MSADPERHETLKGGLATLEPMLEADGFTLSLEDVDADRATVRLAANEDACIDCLMPEDALRDVVLQTLREHDPSVNQITLHMDVPEA